MLVSGTSPPEYEIGTSDRSSAPRRSALNCELTFTSDEFGIDVELERAVGALLDVLRELAHEAIAKVALVDRAAGKLVRDLEGRGLRRALALRRAPAEWPQASRRSGVGEKGSWLSSRTLIVVVAASAIRCRIVAASATRKMMRQGGRLRNGPKSVQHGRAAALSCRSPSGRRGRRGRMPMTCRIVALLAAALAIAPAAAAPAIDYAREDRWAQEIVPSIVVGDAVWLATPARAKVLAILTEPSGTPQGRRHRRARPRRPSGFRDDRRRADVARRGRLHDAVGADAGACRRRIARRLRRHAAGSRRPDRRGDRVSARERYRRRSRSSRTAWARRWRTRISRGRDMRLIDAWVPVGMLVDFATPPKEPVVDIVAESESERGHRGRAAAHPAAAAGCDARARSRSPGPIIISRAGRRSSPRRSRRFSIACSPVTAHERAQASRR